MVSASDSVAVSGMLAHGGRSSIGFPLARPASRAPAVARGGRRAARPNVNIDININIDGATQQ
jgi:hypothetical protein